MDVMKQRENILRGLNTFCTQQKSSFYFSLMSLSTPYRQKQNRNVEISANKMKYHKKYSTLSKGSEYLGPWDISFFIF